ncbi:MAG: chemotaxis protein CheW [Mariprofundales bacterium]
MSSKIPPIQALSVGEGLQDTYHVSGTSDVTNIVRRAVKVGDFGLLFPDNNIGEILDPAPAVHGIPHTTVWFSGVVNIRGNIVPVFNMRALLNKKQVAASQARLFVYGQGEMMVAFFIDDLPVVMRFEKAQQLQHNPVETALDKYIKDVYLSEDIVWMDADMQAMFTGLAEQIA